MQLLLDTHIALWAITDSPKLSANAREIIESEQATIWVSVASLWEIAIKYALGRGNMPVSGAEAAQYFRDSGFQFLSVDPEHALMVERLPAYHTDPFDRIIIAQALTEPMRLITHDAVVSRYSDTVVRV